MKIKFLIFLNILVLNCFGMQPVTVSQRIATAINTKDAQIFAKILNQGLDVDKILKLGNQHPTLLGLAAKINALDIAELLIMREASVNLVDTHNLTPLDYAVRNGHHDMAKLLLQHKANPYTNNKPFLNAIYKDDRTMVQIFFDNGFKILHACAHYGRQTFDYEKAISSPEMRNLLKKQLEKEETEAVDRKASGETLQQ